MVWIIYPDTSRRYSPGVRARNEGGSGSPDRGGLSFAEWVVEPLKQGHKLEHPERMPKVGYIPKTRSRFYTIMSIYDQFAGLQEFVELVEQFEPGVHEFYPIDLIAQDTGETLPVKYMVLNICSCLKSVVLDHPAVSVNQFGEGAKQRTFWTRLTRDMPPVFHRDGIAGKHIWRDDGARVGVYASDEFVNALEDCKFKGWVKYEHFEAV